MDWHAVIDCIFACYCNGLTQKVVITLNSIEKQFKKNEKKKNSAIRNWWRKNDYKVYRVLLFYVYIPVYFYEKAKKTRYDSMKYSDELTKKYLDKVLPKLVARYEESPNEILFHNTEDFGGIRFYWDLCSNYMRKKFKKETRYFTKFDSKVREYIIDEYTIDGYEKLKLLNWTDWSKAKEKFGWYSTPYNTDYAKGAMFYKEGAVDEKH